MLIQRQQDILAEVSKKGTVSVSKLIALAKSSPATIRRDLTYLEKNHFIVRSHGFVHAVNATNNVLPVNKRSLVAAVEKTKIARLAAGLIQDGMTLLLDSGTTCQEIARHISQKKVTVVTNSIEICRILLSSDVNVISCGGMLVKEQQCFLGPDAIAFLKKIEVDLTFVGATGIRSTIGLTTSSPLQLDFKKEAIRIATRSYAVFDTQKFFSANLYLFAEFSELDGLITNAPEEDTREEALLGIIEDNGIQVYRAK